MSECQQLYSSLSLSLRLPLIPLLVAEGCRQSDPEDGGLRPSSWVNGPLWQGQRRGKERQQDTGMAALWCAWHPASLALLSFSYCINHDQRVWQNKIIESKEYLILTANWHKTHIHVHTQTFSKEFRCINPPFLSYIFRTIEFSIFGFAKNHFINPKM